MSKREQNMALIRKIAGAAFGVSFLMAIMLFTDYRIQFLGTYTIKMAFIISGGIGLLLNLLTFQSGKNHSIYNLLYWSGSIVLFIGMVFLLMRWPYGYYIIVVGLIVLGGSFILPSKFVEHKPEDSGLLDD